MRREPRSVERQEYRLIYCSSLLRDSPIKPPGACHFPSRACGWLPATNVKGLISGGNPVTSENHWVRIGLMSLKPAGLHRNTWMCTLEQALNSHCTAALRSCFCHEGVKPRKPGEQGGRCMHQNAQAISQSLPFFPWDILWWKNLGLVGAFSVSTKSEGQVWVEKA